MEGSCQPSILAECDADPVMKAGVRGSAVQWGAWSGIGMVAANAAVLQRMERGGLQTVHPTMGLAILSRTLTQCPGPQVNSNHKLVIISISKRLGMT